MPHISSQWMEEIERHGPYPTSTKFNNLEHIKIKQQIPIPNNQPNPYMEAFWKWWPKMYIELKEFRITGGEPLLSKDTFKVLDYIIENPNPNLSFSVNTNLNPPKELFNKFIEKVKIIQEKKCVKKFQIYTSAEAHGKQAEYIRHGLDYKEWLNNIDLLLTEVPTALLSVTSTYNILSVISFKQFLEDVLSIRKKYKKVATENNRTPITIDIPYLRFPTHQAVYLMPEKYITYVEEQLELMRSNTEKIHGHQHTGFYDHEIHKLERIYNVIKSEMSKNNPNLITDRKDFIAFVDEHDKRRGTNFLQTFPEFTEMYNDWKIL